MDDLNVIDLAEHLSFLDPMPEATRELDKWKSRYPSQKIHMISWLEWQTHTYKGAYGREKPNESARTMYNRFMNPGGLCWLADALGENEAVLMQATEAAKEAEKKEVRARCKAFRKVIPWERIMELFENPSQWRYDPQMQEMIQIGKDGYPKIKKVQKSQFEKVYFTEAGM